MTRLFRLGVIKKIPRIIASGWRRECEIQGLLLDAGKSRRALTKQLQYILVFLVGSSAKTQERVSGTAVSGGGAAFLKDLLESTREESLKDLTCEC